MKKLIEGEDFDIIPDVEAAKSGDKYPWKMQFLGREIKIHGVKIEDDSPVLTMNIDYISGKPFNKKEIKLFGNLITQLLEEYVEREKTVSE